MRIVDLCRVIQKKGIDPFQVDVRNSLETLRKYLPNWKVLDELLADSEAINQIASIIRLQEEWVKHKASSFYIDPLLMELKIRITDPKDLVDAFLESWHPIASLEHLHSRRLLDSLDYWNGLLPIRERYADDVFSEPRGINHLDLSELIAMEILSTEEFEESLQRLSNELASRGKTDYWSFIHTPSFKETVKRAYLTSFLLAEELAILEVNSLNEEMFLSPVDPTIPSDKKNARSTPTYLNYETWENMLKAR